MIRYVILLILYIPFYLLAMGVAPILPVFSTMRQGKLDNNNSVGVGPRLPTWLSWFDTDDNSLWGDHGWRSKHCPKYWSTYIGAVLWLWRNPACGFARQVLIFRLSPDETFDVVDSGRYLDVDKGNGTFGWFLIKSRSGAFHYRWVRLFGFGKVITFEAGWALDDYIKVPSTVMHTPIASFVFQPQIKTIHTNI